MLMPCLPISQSQMDFGDSKFIKNDTPTHSSENTFNVIGEKRGSLSAD